ncbi:hypothetical protein GCM10010228_29770 [Streptomyces massasporeus]|nr:hypothetical protein GCM10010228_29770 [Streptomyces massasporeus]
MERPDQPWARPFHHGQSVRGGEGRGSPSGALTVDLRWAGRVVADRAVADRVVADRVVAGLVGGGAARNAALCCAVRRAGTGLRGNCGPVPLSDGRWVVRA